MDDILSIQRENKRKERLQDNGYAVFSDGTINFDLVEPIVFDGDGVPQITEEMKDAQEWLEEEFGDECPSFKIGYSFDETESKAIHWDF